ncbi:ABC transporter ATP-binding protein [Halorubrum lacusprofundi]|jgi:peptide/nickel transport system ATP-binding protein|uniref:Oligopeptide/dipeptide ABC transporter, ATPase subunit n=1 Tax=Halorubrum lacusprofundi (strain ATCC 49239 / DSM 5036 / JCM 8891 / ACAM 34) TaxID=416348 RepID=B9LRN0_HALLT|nr:ABC transporter ATP-binding protein [Halorubrum lacusprofundi]ACM55853.1 oligopeptide/dipeptide ABC transporter, ATPase subunit [Halorubrum lacusprofundi ATCC 49239]MCG1006722.1 ABC transporter ATP-binding protein [Halorubrum lacusprofundi]
MTDPLVTVDGLEKYYYENDTLLDRLTGAEPEAVQAVDGVSFEVREGETLGVVGESGCGKSTLAETLMRLRDPTGGSVTFDGEPVFELSGGDLDAFRRRAQVMFQDPFSSLDPRMTAGEIITEPLAIHDVGTSAERRERAESLLEEVGLSADQIDRYPHEFSGGQRQRIGFARALAIDPEFIVLDEPVSALDVSVQAQVLNLLADMQAERDLTYLFIAHDLSVVRHISDRVAVMYLGKVVEIGPTEEIFEDPQHPYTKALLESVPRADTEERSRTVETIRGDVPSPRNPPSGCSFRTRCPELIQPPGLDVPQAAFREISEFRTRIENGNIDVDLRWEQVDDPDREDRTAFVDSLRSEAFDEELPAADEDVILEAIRALADGDREAAAATLRERYRSPCEAIEPALPAGDHPSACLLNEQPDEVETAHEEWEASHDAPGVGASSE